MSIERSLGAFTSFKGHARTERQADLAQIEAIKKWCLVAIKDVLKPYKDNLPTATHEWINLTELVGDEEEGEPKQKDSTSIADLEVLRYDKEGNAEA